MAAAAAHACTFVCRPPCPTAACRLPAACLLPCARACPTGEALQIKLELLPEVARAYVHLDHEATHRPEH